MQTIYYTTANFVRHTGNVVDLEACRQKLALAQEGSLAPELEPCTAEDWSVLEQEEISRPAERPRRSARRARRAWLLDSCASLSVVVMTLVFTLRVLAF